MGRGSRRESDKSGFAFFTLMMCDDDDDDDDEIRRGLGNDTTRHRTTRHDTTDWSGVGQGVGRSFDSPNQRAQNKAAVLV